MRVLKETVEFRVDSEIEAKEAMEAERLKAKEKGYIISKAGYTYKEKKSKGDVIDCAYVVTVVKVFGGVWDEV